MLDNSGRAMFVSCLLMLTMLVVLAGCSVKVSAWASQPKTGEPPPPRTAETLADRQIQLLAEEARKIEERLAVIRNLITPSRMWSGPRYTENRTGLVIQIAEYARRIAELRGQQAVAVAAVELADREDFRDSPDVLHALDADLEIRVLTHVKAYIEIQHAERLAQFGLEHESVQALERQIELAAKRVADARDAAVERAMARVKADRQVVLTNTLEQLRSLYMHQEDCEARLKDHDKSTETLETLRAEERRLVESLHRIKDKMRDVRLQRIADEFEQQRKN